MKPELLIALAIGALLGLALIAGLAHWIDADRRRFRALLGATAWLTFALVVLGAYVRLSDAGLGCPDWPGCYGHVDVPKTAAEQAQASAAYPGTSVDTARGWKEMGHRYIAGVLGILILAIAFISVRRRTLFGSPLLALALVGIVLFQAALGRWTVTLLLKPAIVTLHLLGGMAILAILTWLSLRFSEHSTQQPARVPSDPSLRRMAILGLVLVAIQIMLGGWVSTNYAGLACPDLPLCRGEWVPPMDLPNAFHVFRELGYTAEGVLLSNEALVAIHWAHRIGAIAVLAYSLFLAYRLRTVDRRWAGLLVAAVGLQFSLGLLNVVLSLPLALAAAHNAGAALLWMTLIVLNFRLRSAVLASSAVPAPVATQGTATVSR